MKIDRENPRQIMPLKVLPEDAAVHQIYWVIIVKDGKITPADADTEHWVACALTRTRSILGLMRMYGPRYAGV